MKIGDLAAKSGLSVHTLRYYERIGLLPRAHRLASGRRDYDPGILTWIEFLGRLKTTGMPIRDMLTYAELRSRGDGTKTERRLLLQQHRDLVRAHVAELTACLAVLDAKIAGYGDPVEITENEHDGRHGSDPRSLRAGEAHSGPDRRTGGTGSR